MNPNITYWLVVSGNAETFSTSFSWLDAKDFNHTAATYYDNSWHIFPNQIGSGTLTLAVQPIELFPIE
jgi:hypothetical protein